MGSGGLDSQPGLSGTAGTSERECATARQEPFDITHLALATNEAAELDGQVVRTPRDRSLRASPAPFWPAGWLGRHDGPRRRRVFGRRAGCRLQAALQDLAVQLFALVGRFQPEFAPKDRAQPLVLAEGRQPPVEERVQAHQIAV